jgi:hypothetical protein
VVILVSFHPRYSWCKWGSISFNVDSVEYVEISLEVVKYGCLFVKWPFEIINDTLVVKEVLDTFAGCDSGSIGFSVSNRRTRTSAAKRAAASGQWESMSVNFARWGSLPLTEMAILGCSSSSCWMRMLMPYVALSLSTDPSVPMIALPV